MKSGTASKGGKNFPSKLKLAPYLKTLPPSVCLTWLDYSSSSNRLPRTDHLEQITSNRSPRTDHLEHITSSTIFCLDTMDTPLNPLTAFVEGPSLKDWQEFRTNLQSAVDASLPTKSKPYNHVSVLILVWAASSEDFHKECNALKRFLETDFGYQAEVWGIPSRSSVLGMSLL